MGLQHATGLYDVDSNGLSTVGGFAKNFSFLDFSFLLFNYVNSTYVETAKIIGKISGSVLWHLDHRTSLARSASDRRQGGYGHTE